MTKLKSKKRHTEPRHANLPDLEMLFKFELSACTKEEVVRLCQNLVNSGDIYMFEHPLRRTAYDLAWSGDVTGLALPNGYLEMNNEPDRETHLNVMVH